MSRMVFVNLAVEDVKRSVAFFTVLGFKFDERFTNDTAAGLILEPDYSYAMLLQKDYFKTFIKTDVADATKTTEVLVALSFDTREAVDEVVRKAVASGGKDVREAQDHCFMYVRAFADPDGHVWEPVWLDPKADFAKEGC